MRNLKMWQKLALMGAIFMIPFAGVTYQMASSINALGLDDARREVQGLEYAAPALTLVKDLQLHRDTASAWLNGAATFKDALAKNGANLAADIKVLDAVDKRLNATLNTTKRWTVVRTACLDLVQNTPNLNPDESFARHSRLIADALALVADLGHASSLTVDPDIEHKRLIDVLLFEGPELTEALARARGFGIGVAASGKKADDQFERLNRESVLAEFLGAKLDESMAKAVEFNDGLRQQLEGDANATTDAVLQATAEIGKLARGGNSTTLPADYFRLVTIGVDSIVNLSSHITTVVNAGLNVRIAALQREVLQTLGWAALGLLVVSVIGFFIMRDITVTLGQVVDVANRIAIGDLTMPSPKARRDELGVLANAFDRMVAALKETVGVAERIASGDLAVTVTPRSNLDVLGKALAHMVERLSTLMGEMQRSGVQVNTSVNQIAATTTEISATSKEISATSQHLVRTMNEVSGVAEQSAALAGSGQAGVARMEETMRHVIDAAASINAKLVVLSQKASGITRVVTTISKVADQTNLLSLNAAIEAEKAGEYGRGFAVVATEIRRLADQTAVATYDIEQTVKEIQSAVSAGVMGMDKFSEEVRRGMHEVQQVGNELSQIIQHVQALPPQFEAVNEGMQAQATGAEQITQALGHLGDAVNETVKSLRASNQVIDGLNHAAMGMRNGVSRIQVAAADRVRFREKKLNTPRTFAVVCSTTVVLVAGLIATAATVRHDHEEPNGAAARYRGAYLRPSQVPHPIENAPNAAREELGRTLFFDPRLSKSGSMSCATCHDPGLSWGDGRARAVGDSKQHLDRRTPTILNLAWAPALFWDGRSDSLEEQALGPIEAAGEMNVKMDVLLALLQGIEGYRPLFARAYPGEAISSTTIGKAIATFERAIVSPDAPFDRFIAGNERAIPADARRGFVLFNEKGRCSVCHSGWRFTDDGFYDVGGVATADEGRGKLTPFIELTRFAFKTPTLRNVARRAPYLHDGSVATLEDVIDLYDIGGIAKRRSLSPEIKPLGLTAGEKKDLAAFLRTLTSDDADAHVPALPR